MGCASDFTTTTWNNPWANVNINTQPCYGNSNSYGTGNSGGNFLVTESIRADESSGCSSNTAEVQINIGTHGDGPYSCGGSGAGCFVAWKSGSAYYTVVANFTFKNLESIGTYCSVSGSPVATASVLTADAMYDHSTNSGVGYATTNVHGDLSSINGNCNTSQSNQDTGTSYSATFATSVAIKQGDYLEVRGSVTADVYVSMPGVFPWYSAHSYSNMDFFNDGYGYITINSIWVS